MNKYVIHAYAPKYRYYDVPIEAENQNEAMLKFEKLNMEAGIEGYFVSEDNELGDIGILCTDRLDENGNLILEDDNNV